MKQQSITELPPSPDDERRARMIRYSIAMSIRMVCVVGMLFVQGWWLAVFAVGAILLPYLAVVIANVSGPKRRTRVLRPGGLLPVAAAPDAGAPGARAADDDAGGWRAS